MSLRVSTSRSPAACSGLMYAAVPIEAPVAVRCSPPPASARAMPKSATSTCPSASSMLSGLMSRWTMPCRCA